MMKKIAGLCLCLAALTMTACGTPASHTDSAPTGVNAGSAGGSETQGTDTAFGTAYTWDDGLPVEVGAPEDYTPGEYAVGTEGFSQFVSFTIRIVNGTSKNWDPSLFYVTLQSGNQEASKVYDTEQLGDSPTTTLLPGREVEYRIAFGVKDPADLVMEVAPDLSYSNVIFHN